MIATVHVTRTATDWVRLGENRIAILAGPVEQVHGQCSSVAASWGISSQIVEESASRLGRIAILEASHAKAVELSDESLLQRRI